MHWCPYTKCGNTRRQTREDMTQHLCNFGFTRDYTRWTYHGDMTQYLCNFGFTRDYTRRTYHGEANRMRDEVVRQRIEDHNADAGVGDMLDDFHEAHFEGEHREEEPEPTAKAYYTMLAAAPESLHGRTKV